MPFISPPGTPGTAAVPREPPPAPRAFHLAALDTSTRFLLLFGAIWTFVGGAITAGFTAGGGPLWNDLILDGRGKRAEAMPTSIDPTGASVNGRRVFRIAFAFFDEAGQPREASADSADRGVLERAARRERLSIDYDPQSPALSRLTGGSASFFGWFVLFPLAFAVVGLAVLRAGFLRVLRTRSLVIRGTAALARVTAVAPTNMRINRRPIMRVEYEFDAVVTRATGSTTSLAPPPVGARLWVLYRPSDPKENVAAPVPSAGSAVSRAS
jgi:hypothetical protein